MLLLNTVNGNSEQLLPNLPENSLFQSCDRVAGFAATCFKFGGFIIDQSWHADTAVDQHVAAVSESVLKRPILIIFVMVNQHLYCVDRRYHPIHYVI